MHMLSVIEYEFLTYKFVLPWIAISHVCELGVSLCIPHYPAVDVGTPKEYFFEHH